MEMTAGIVIDKLNSVIGGLNLRREDIDIAHRLGMKKKKKPNLVKLCFEAVLTGTYNICFQAKIRKIMYTHVNPSFTISKWGLRGSKLYRRVFVMGKVT